MVVLGEFQVLGVMPLESGNLLPELLVSLLQLGDRLRLVVPRRLQELDVGVFLFATAAKYVEIYVDTCDFSVRLCLLRRYCTIKDL